MKKLIMKLCEKAVNWIWDVYLKTKERLFGIEIHTLTVEKARRIKKNCVRW